MTNLRVEKHTSQDGKDSLSVASENGAVRPEAWEDGRTLRFVGRSHPRVEGHEKVTGHAEYTYDVRLPGQLYAKVLRSPHPYARIRGIDSSRALALPGVRAVVSSASHPDLDWWKDGKLFDSTVRFVGDEVAAVAADSEELAEDALRLIQVDYEPLPFAATLEDAQQPDAPKIHTESKQPGNLTEEPSIYQRGDPDAAFNAAEVVIVEQSYATAAALHNSLEPHGCVAVWRGDYLTLWASTQSVFDVREQVAKRLKLPQHHVRVIQQHVGGGFGAKQIAWKPAGIAALLSKGAGRPVQLMLDRRAENLASGNRNPTRQHVRLAARRDGTLTAIWVHIEQAAGAYTVGGESADVPGIYQTLYRCPNVHTEQEVLYTNTGPAVAFRAPGYVEGAFGLECAMDELAHKLGMDPVVLRLRNLPDRDQQVDKPYSSPTALRETISRVREASRWDRADREGSNGTKRRGFGFAIHNWIGGGGKPPGYAWVKVNGDGTVDVVTGTQDIGTGTRTGLLQVAAEELGLPIERLTLHLGDTATGPYSPVSSGSATQATIGPAIQAAAAEARRQILEAAAVWLEVRADDLELQDGTIQVKGAPRKQVKLEDITSQISPHMILGEGARSANPPDVAIRTFGAQVVEVEVDTATGQVDVLNVWASHDCGRIVNPLLVDSQVIGAVTQGVGYALTEERVLDARLGHVLNANLEEYHVPTVADIPHIQHVPLDLPDLAANPTGAKGAGEPPLIPTAPAIANAVYDAIGVRLVETPLLRGRVLDALVRQKEAAA